MISRFFIDRPIFAAVLSIVITLTGAIALFYLPIAQYPRVTPPQIQVAITYPGASAQVVSDTVAAPIEQQVNGVPNMLYMSSQMGNDGSYTLVVTFDLGTDLDTALVMVQNRVMLALPLLPTSVQNQGITIRKKTPDILNVVNFYSPDGRYDQIYLSNYATIHIQDELLRLEGVSDIIYLGQRAYSIRAWLDPQKLASLNMTVLDVANAIRNQNLDAPAGMLAEQPSTGTRSLELPIDTLGRLTTPEQFGDLIVKAVPGQGPTVTNAPITLASSNFGMPLPGSTGQALSSGNFDGAMVQPSPNTQQTSSNTSDATFDSSISGSLASVSATMGSPTSTSTSGAATTSTTSPTGVTSSAMTPTNSLPSNLTSSSITNPFVNGGASSGLILTTATDNTMDDPNAVPLSGGAAPASASTGVTGLNIPGAAPTSIWTQLSIASGILTATQTPATMRPTVPTQTASIVRLRDVARIELGAQSYTLDCTYDGHPSVGLGIFQLPGTNALEVAGRIRAKMQELKADFPEGVEYEIAYDTTPFIRDSVVDVVKTLLVAVALVAVVVLVFLQNWRATLIPLIAVPVAIVGTFSVMALLNFSLNNVSLFGLVLAIGIVVDDAIVVVENVERWLERGLPPREAARKAMDEVTGPVVAVALVLCAVFVPCAFISGITGQFFRQFAVTIAVSTVFSAINSLTLSPALAAILLRPHGARRDPLTRLLDFMFGWLFRMFNWTFRVGTAGYGWLVGRLLRVNAIALVVYGGLLALTWWTFQSAPVGFVPDQDQGRIICAIQLPDSASLERTQTAMSKIEAIARRMPGVAHTVAISGFSFVLQANSPNFASMFVVLDPFEKRRSPDLKDTAIIAKLRTAWANEVKDARVIAFQAPAIPGIGVAGGFKYMVEDRGGLGLEALQSQTEAFVRKLQANTDLMGVSNQFSSNTPQLFADIDRTKVATLGVSLLDVNQTMGLYLGSLYVNSYNQFGRYWQVTIQAEGKYRSQIENINLLQVRNMWGQMVPLGTLVNVREVGGPVYLTRYNLASAAPINGGIAPGVSTGEAIQQIEKLSHESLPISMLGEWTEVMFMQIKAGNTAMYVFALSVVSVFLALAALYESWSLPLAVILVVPMCLLCSVAGVLFAHIDVNIFVQIGFVVLVGLACKNAILIVEFARQTHQDGKPRFEATVEASQLRLRPILMTSLAFILGVFPLVIASGAGAEMRRSLGTAVFSGMLGVTMFGIFLTPIFFYVILGLTEMSLFSSKPARRAVSVMFGGLLGLVVAFLLARVFELSSTWEMVLGSVGAISGTLLILSLEAMASRRAALAPVAKAPGGDDRP